MNTTNFDTFAGRVRYSFKTVAIVLCVVFFSLLESCKPDSDCEDAPQVIPSPVVDQSTSLTPNPPFSYNIESFAPVGQRFIPTLYALDFVTLYIDDASCSLSGSPGGDLLVKIRKSSLTGEVIGTSNAIHFENCFTGIKQFQFSRYIPLSPGQEYFIEVAYVSGNSSTAYVSLNPQAYARGEFYLDGVSKPDMDLVFQEGIYHSLPKSKCDCLERFHRVIGPTGLRFKNTGDCIKFVISQRPGRNL